jgi:hypothetical protein
MHDPRRVERQAGEDRFSIHPAKGLFNCRICGLGGKGSIDLEMFVTGAEFVDAVKALTGLPIPTRTSASRRRARLSSTARPHGCGRSGGRP